MSTAAAEPAAELSGADRLQPVLLLGSIGVGLALGGVAPGLARSLSVGVSLGVFVLIFLVMLNVDVGRVARATKQRRFVATAVILNFAVNPALAWALGTIFLRGDPDLRAGLILFLVTPCIGWYLVFTEMARGDTDLGVSLLGVNVVLQVLLLPLYLTLLVGSTTPIAASTIARSIAVYLVLPALSAAVTRRWWKRRGLEPAVAQQRLGVPTLKTIALAAVIISMFASQASAISANTTVFARLLAPIALFFVTAFIVAVSTARYLRLPHDQTALLAFTTTSRNSEASLAIAATAFASPLVGLTVVLGPVVELPLLIVMVRVLDRMGSRRPGGLRRRRRRAPAVAAPSRHGAE